MVMLWGSVADRPPTMHAVARFSFCLVAVALAVVPSGTRAEVYKCAGEGAIPVYQEVPCAKGRELRNFQTDPPEITILPAPSRANPAPSAAKNATANDAKSGKDAKPGKSTTAGDASERKLIRTGMTEAEVLAHCRLSLAEFKCPKKIFIVEAIPRTATGKIQRRNVASALKDEV